MAESYVFYRSYYEALKELDPETRLRFYDAITEYALTEKNPEFTGIEKALWVQIQIGIDNARSRYIRSVESGKKGGRPKAVENLEKPNKTLRFSEENLEKPNANLNVDVDVDVDVNANENVNANLNANANETEGFSCENPQPVSIPDTKTPEKNRRFVKPTVEEVRAYCTERRNGIDPEAFCAFYESKGWMIGTGHMKDWRSAVITWEKRRKTEATGGHVKAFDRMTDAEIERYAAII